MYNSWKLFRQKRKHKGKSMINRYVFKIYKPCVLQLRFFVANLNRQATTKQEDTGLATRIS